MLKRLLEERLERRNMSVREAAKELEVGHTTIHRVLDEKPVDLPSIIKICKWLGIRPSVVLDTDFAEDTGPSDHHDRLEKQVAAVLAHDPRLTELFSQLSEDLIAGKISDGDIEDILSFAEYRIKSKAVQNAK